MQLFHRSTALSATFDDVNLVSSAGLVPAMVLATSTGLAELANRWLTLPGYFGANAGLKVTALIAGMLAGADSIDDMALLRHGGLKKLFVGAYAPSTLGSFLRAFTCIVQYRSRSASSASGRSASLMATQLAAAYVPSRGIGKAT
nr:hypothetical protein BJQ95_03084 [Cryobacterium sp. SO1]